MFCPLGETEIKLLLVHYLCSLIAYSEYFILKLSHYFGFDYITLVLMFGLLEKALTMYILYMPI